MAPTLLWPFKKCPTVVLTATVAITNGPDVVVAVSLETATNPVHISSRISYVFLLCILIIHKQLYLVINKYLKKHEKLSAAKDFFNCSHRYTKYLIVGLSLYKNNCMMAWETNDFKYISDLKVSF